MCEMKTLVKIVIPLYKNRLLAWEEAALRNNLRVLSSYPVCFVYPAGIDFEEIFTICPQAERLAVSGDWLGKKRGIQGYNEMMMSKEFYDMFIDCKYILICHTDAWIFKDELSEWCAKDYDIVAAPWPLRPRYRMFPLNLYVWCRKMWAAALGKISRVQMFGRIGNGGLCLRKVVSFSEACERYAKEIAIFNSCHDGMHNEDIFWALIPHEFSYPDVKTALSFAYDLKPRLCHELNAFELPMGCHGFMHDSRIGFWTQYIPGLKSSFTK